MSEKIKYLFISLVIASVFVLGNKAAAEEVTSEEVTIGEAMAVSSSSDNDGVMGNIVSIDVTDDVTVSVGGGVRADADFNITNDTNTFAIDNARLVFGVDTSYGVGADISGQYDGTGTNNFDLLDASVNFNLPVSFLDEIKGGRFIAPAAQATLADTYGQITWEPPTVVSRYASLNGYGRLDGAAIYGGVNDIADAPVSVNYQLGAFQGLATDNALVAGRLGVDVYGVDVGFAFQTQQEAVNNSDFLGWNFDTAYSRKIGPGTATVNGGFFKYDLDDAAYTPGTGLNEGFGGYALGAYALDDFALNAGKLSIVPQPFVQYQNFQFKGANSGDEVEWNAGANFIFHENTNTKLTVSYFNNELLGVTNEGVIVGLQFAF